MMTWLKKRLAEPTTYIGAGFLAHGALVLTKADPQHTAVVTETIAQVATPISQGDYTAAIISVMSGLIGVLMSEKAK